MSGRERPVALVDGPEVPRLQVDGVLSHHLNPFRSGVARFNQVLAERLGIPDVGVLDAAADRFQRPLLSFKAGEMTPEEQDRVRLLLARLDGYEVFLHDWSGTGLEREMVAGSNRVWCGNHEVFAAVEGLARDARLVWAPGLVLDHRRYQPAEVSLFSFGMAHKVRTDMFARLKRLLDASGRTYALYLSHANHETATLEDARLVYDEMHRIFPTALYFLGNLSDVAVHNHLLSANYFAAFFAKGARANNTSIASAMEHGCVVITNLDEHSPASLRHMENVIDIERCDALPSDPLVLRKIGVTAMETARSLGWDALVERVRAG
jgi:hypothetical protein